MPPVEKSKGLLITFRGTSQQKVVPIVSCDPRLPCHGVCACSRCVLCLLPYFPSCPQKVPQVAELRTLSVSKFRFHSGLDARRAWGVSAKSTPVRSLPQLEMNGFNLAAASESFAIPMLLHGNY